MKMQNEKLSGLICVGGEKYVHLLDGKIYLSKYVYWKGEKNNGRRLIGLAFPLPKWIFFVPATMGFFIGSGVVWFLHWGL
jgi:hypothetical protein